MSPSRPAYLIAVDQIYHSAWAIPRLARLRRLRRLIEQRWSSGHPTRLVQVGGTSGKGSVSRFIEAALSLRGASGSLTSPHLFDYRERFSVHGRPPAQRELSRLWERRVRDLAIDYWEKHNQSPGYQELNLLLALELFAHHDLRYACLEVGLGGLYDATSAAPVDACVLTCVGHDHEHRLGSEPWQRALEKASMVRQGGALYTAEADPAVLSVVEAICEERGAEFHAVDAAAVDMLWRAVPDELISANSRLCIPHQRINAALAFTVAQRFEPTLTFSEAVASMDRVELLGRLSNVAEGLYIDVAHNPDKLAALAQEIVRRFPGQHIHIIAGVSGNRSPAANIRPLLEVATTLTLTRAGFKGHDPEDLRQELEVQDVEIPVEVCADPQEAVATALERRPSAGVVVLTGSTFTIDQALNPDPLLKHLNATYGWRNL